MDIFIIVSIVGSILLGSFWLSFVLGRRKSKIGLGMLGGLWAAFTAILFFGMNEASGLDGLGYLVFLLGVSAPAGVGGLVGALIGWAGDNAANNEQPSTGPRDIDTATVAR